MKIFDLNKKYNFTKNVQNNILLLKKLFTSTFKIKSDKIKITVKIIKEKLKTCNLTYYSLILYQKKRTKHLHPFKIDFYDINKLIKNNNTYISNIHKTNTISGSKMINLVLAIQKKLNVKKTYIEDGASVKCQHNSMDLSSFKMIEKFKTFYMKYGFQMEIKSSSFYLSYKTKKQQNEYLSSLIGDIKKIKIKTIINDLNKIIDILAKVIKKNDYQNLIIKNLNSTGIKPSAYYYVEYPENKISRIFDLSHKVILILNNTNEAYLYKYLIKLFNNQTLCSDYITLWGFLNNGNYNILEYKNIIVDKSYVELFKILDAIVYWDRKYYYEF